MRTAAIALILSAVFVFSGQSEARKHERKGHMKKMMKELNLTAEQQEKVKKIRKDFKVKIKPLKEQMKTVHKTVETAFVGTGSNADVKKAHDGAVALKSQIHTLKFDKKLAMRDVLNTEQRKKFFEMQHRKHKGSMED